MVSVPNVVWGKSYHQGGWRIWNGSWSMITLRSPWAKTLRCQEKRLSSTTRIPLFIILVTGHEIQMNSSQEMSQMVVLFEIVHIEAQHQEIQLLFYFRVSFLQFSIVFSMVKFDRIRHVYSSLRNILMGKPRYPRCNVHNRWWNPHSGIPHCHQNVNRICQRLSGKF